MTWDRLSLSITVADGTALGCCCGCVSDFCWRRFRAKSPSEGGSSCAKAAKGVRRRQKANACKMGNFNRMISVAKEYALSGTKTEVWARWGGKEVTGGKRRY